MRIRFRPANNLTGDRAQCSITDNEGREVDIDDALIAIQANVSAMESTAILEIAGELDLEFDGLVMQHVPGLTAHDLVRALSAESINQAIVNGSVRESPGEIIYGHLSELLARLTQ